MFCYSPKSVHIGSVPKITVFEAEILWDNTYRKGKMKKKKEGSMRNNTYTLA